MDIIKKKIIYMKFYNFFSNKIKKKKKTIKDR